MRQIAIMIMVFLCACSTEFPGDQGIFLDSSVEDGSVTDQNVVDGQLVDQGHRGDARLGEECFDDLDCTSAHHVCEGNVCDFRNSGSCDRFVTGDDTEKLCGVSDGVESSVVEPLRNNDIPEGWVWCLPAFINENPVGNRCTSSNQAPSCSQDSDCVGHFENADCYFNVCRTLNCPTPLATTGCQSGEICSGLNLCVEN